MNKPTNHATLIQVLWESLNGCVYDLEKGNPQDALTTIQDLIQDLEDAGANATNEE